jgi:cysteine desulfurase / selenocysteine lyase
MPRIYLDNAATSWPKPESAYRAVDDYQRRLGSPAGRSVYSEAVQTERLVHSCRKKIADLLNLGDPARIIFTQNGTDSLNLALHGLLKPGDHVVTTVCEHNSVLRPLSFLADRGVTATYVPCDGEGYVDPAAIRQAINANTRLIALIHASNVTGAIQPAAAVGKIANDNGILFLLDAAQSLGYVEIDIAKLGCHLLAAPGHKGLMGPLGTGILYVAPAIEQHLQPIRQGGTGTKSDQDRQPSELPDRYESGNLNVPGIVGLEAGATYVAQLGVPHVEGQTRALVQRLLSGLTGLPGLRIYGPRTGDNRVGVVSLNLAGFDPRELAAILDSQWQIQTRAGLHCAPKMHAALKTLPSGTLRFSFGHFTTQEQVDAAIAALAELTAG